MIKSFAELIGKNSSWNPATLMDTDILGDYPNKDQISDLYNMVIHADSVCLAREAMAPFFSPCLAARVVTAVNYSQSWTGRTISITRGHQLTVTNRMANDPAPTTTSVPPWPTPPSTP